MRKIRWNYIIKAIVFLGLVVWMLLGVVKIFNYKQTGGGGGWQRFYAAEKNSIDVMFFGSSHAHCTIDLGYMWDTYGIAGYTLSAGSQNISGTYYFVKEALQTQRPKVILIECFGAVGGEIVNSDADVYRNTLGMRWGSTLWEYTLYLQENMGKDRTWAQQVYTKIPLIHSRYAELEQMDFEDNLPFMRGYRGSYEGIGLERPAAESVTDVIPLHSDRFEMLENIVLLAREQSIPVVLFVAPYMLNDYEQAQYNAIEQWAELNGIPFVKFNHNYDAIDLDFQMDFRDEHHVNNIGAQKVTAQLIDYILELYELPDRRNDADYVLWEQNALYLRNKELRQQLEIAVDINEYLKILSQLEDNQTVIIALTGNYKALGEVYLETLMELGVKREEYESGGAWIISDGECIQYLSGTEYDYFEITKNGEIHLQSYETDAGQYKETVNLWLNGQNYRMVENGVNIIVYNEELDQIIDVAGDDIYLGLELIHNEKPAVEW